jgi:hypothetical protein
LASANNKLKSDEQAKNDELDDLEALLKEQDAKYKAAEDKLTQAEDALKQKQQALLALGTNCWGCRFVWLLFSRLFVCLFVCLLLWLLLLL